MLALTTEEKYIISPSVQTSGTLEIVTCSRIDPGSRSPVWGLQSTSQRDQAFEQRRLLMGGKAREECCVRLGQVLLELLGNLGARF
jgi:hypothetical protein